MGRNERNGTVGFVGLGTMGREMALNLLKVGFAVCAYDVRKDAIDDLVTHGATGAGTLPEATRDAVAPARHAVATRTADLARLAVPPIARPSAEEPANLLRGLRPRRRRDPAREHRDVGGRGGSLPLPDRLEVALEEDGVLDRGLALLGLGPRAGHPRQELAHVELGEAAPPQDRLDVRARERPRDAGLLVLLEAVERPAIAEESHGSLGSPIGRGRRPP